MTDRTLPFQPQPTDPSVTARGSGGKVADYTEFQHEGLKLNFTHVKSVFKLMFKVPVACRNFLSPWSACEAGCKTHGWQ